MQGSKDQGSNGRGIEDKRKKERVREGGSSKDNKEAGRVHRFSLILLTLGIFNVIFKVRKLPLTVRTIGHGSTLQDLSSFPFPLLSFFFLEGSGSQNRIPIRPMRRPRKNPSKIY